MFIWTPLRSMTIVFRQTWKILSLKRVCEGDWDENLVNFGSLVDTAFGPTYSDSTWQTNKFTFSLWALCRMDYDGLLVSDSFVLIGLSDLIMLSWLNCHCKRFCQGHVLYCDCYLKWWLHRMYIGHIFS